MEQHKLVRIPVILKGPNYITWSRLTRTALGGRGLWEHITTSEAPRQITQGEDGKEVVVVDEGKWGQEDLMVLSILQGSLDTPIMESYSHCETAKKLWDTLHKVYGNTSNLTRIFEVKRAINNLQQEEMDFTKHLGKYSQLWSELEMLRPSTTDPSTLEERREQDKVFGLLLTLNPSFNDVLKHILRAKELPSYDDVCAQLRKELGSDGLFGGKGELSMANKAEKMESASVNKAHFKPRRGGDKSVTCEHCKNLGHSKTNCWILHPHLRPASTNRYNQAKAHEARAHETTVPGSMRIGEDGRAMISTTHTGGSTSHAMSQPSPDDAFIRKSDIEALIKAINANSGNISVNALNSIHSASHTTRPLIIDSGASHHMIRDARLISDVKPALGSVVIANGDRIPIEGIGNLKLFDKESQAFYMPTFTSNLLSVKRATNDLNCNVIFSPNDVCFQDIKTRKMLGKGVSKGELYLLENTKLSNLSCAFNSASVLASDVLWHARLGHPHYRALGLMLPNLSLKSGSCEACILGKHQRSVFPNSKTIYENCFDLVHSDVWTAPCMSRENHKYFVTFIDEKSKYTWLTLIQTKDRVLEAFINFQNYVSNHFNSKIKIFRSDNGGEYTSTAFKHHLAKHGIIHQTSCPYTPQQNGVAERKNRHLMEVARSMMFHTNVPKRFWGDAVVSACYLINRIPTKVLQDISPFQVLNKIKPPIDHLRVFGCVCYVLIPGEQRNKLEAKSAKGMFIGYTHAQKGYKCYIPESRRVMVSRDVKFVESKGYYDEKSWESLQDLSQGSSDRANNLRIILENLGISQPQTSGIPSTSPIPPVVDEAASVEEAVHPDHEGGNQPNLQIHEEAIIHQEAIHEEAIHDEAIHEKAIQEEVVNDQDGMQQEVQPLRRSTRVKKPSQWMDTKVYFNNNAVAHPIQATCSFARLSEEHVVFISNLDQEYVPKTYEEAMKHKEWRDSVGDEVGAMIKNDTWYETELPKGKKAVTSRLLFTIKYLANGKPERKKTRLVARGYTQVYGEDYLDTFAPVAKLHTIRILLSLVVNLEWDLWQMDVKNASWFPSLTSSYGQV